MDEDKNMFVGLMYAGQICCGTCHCLGTIFKLMDKLDNQDGKYK